MRHSYTTCDRCKGKIDERGAAVLQFTKYNGRSETDRTQLFDLCMGCYFTVIETITHPSTPQPAAPQPYPLT